MHHTRALGVVARRLPSGHSRIPADALPITPSAALSCRGSPSSLISRPLRFCLPVRCHTSEQCCFCLCTGAGPASAFFGRLLPHSPSFPPPLSALLAPCRSSLTLKLSPSRMPHVSTPPPCSCYFAHPKAPLPLAAAAAAFTHAAWPPAWCLHQTRNAMMAGHVAKRADSRPFGI